LLSRTVSIASTHSLFDLHISNALSNFLFLR
jgi:hypothetical protein